MLCKDNQLFCMEISSKVLPISVQLLVPHVAESDPLFSDPCFWLFVSFLHVLFYWDTVIVDIVHNMFIVLCNLHR